MKKIAISQSNYIPWRGYFDLIASVDEFVIFDDRNANAENHCFAKICLSKENYKRLTIPPKVWFGFKGVDEKNSIILNVSDMKHDPDEVQRASLDEILFNWEI